MISNYDNYSIIKQENAIAFNYNFFSNYAFLQDLLKKETENENIEAASRILLCLNGENPLALKVRRNLFSNNYNLIDLLKEL